MPMMKNLSFLTIIVSLIAITSCKSKKSNEKSILGYGVPPGTIEIAHNLYLDETEISNFSYLEYLWWTARVYKNKDGIYKKALPDTGAWSRLGKYYEHKATLYLRHPVSRNFPVTGITYQQALDFCKWRSDRVMEFILIREGFMDHVPSPHKDSVFTIEKYFTGEYKLKRKSEYDHYPCYTLPDSATFMRSIHFADSLNTANNKSANKKCYTSDPLQLRYLETIADKNDTIPFGKQPTVDLGDCYRNKKPLIIHLCGNVRELTADPKFSFGGSFKDSRSCKLFLPVDSTNAYTGFRCVCSWKKWEGSK